MITDTSPLFFLSAFFEEDFPQNVFLLVESVVILDVVVVRLVKYTIWIVVAVRVLVPDSSDLTELNMWIPVLVWIFTSKVWLRIRVESGLAWSTRLREILASKKQHLLVETTDHRYFWLLLRLLTLRLGCRLRLLAIGLYLLSRRLCHLLLLTRGSLLWSHIHEGMRLHLRGWLQSCLRRMHNLMSTLPLARDFSS